MQPLVSVIINCFNGERYLNEAIDSVYAQTYSNWEIIFWDNASTDKSPDIASGYDGRMRCFRGEVTVPLGAARNRALQEAKGKYIAFLDCDDIWVSDKLARQIEAMQQGDFALCYGGVTMIDERGQIIGRRSPKPQSGPLFARLLRQFDIDVPTVLLRRSALLTSGLNFDPKVTASEEYCLFMQLAVEHGFCALPFVVAKYRVHDAALTNRSVAMWADEREYTLNLICAKHPGIRERYVNEFDEAYARARYYRARYFVVTGNKLKALSELRKNLAVSYIYAFLFMLLLLPTCVWNRVHMLRSRRTRLV